MLTDQSLAPILRLAHCRSTHHRFLVDAISGIETDPGRRLARLLVCHYGRLFAGATDPDTRFRDFHNHVIHVDDGYWGGAPRVAHQWHERIRRYLRTDRFSDAAHAAGVLSHYFTDVMQPLHTEAGPREQVVHRPLECSVHHAYDAIAARYRDVPFRVVFQLSDRPQWLGEAMLHAARFAHGKRELLLSHFACERFALGPRAALDAESEAAIAELFALAITGLARVLERIAEESESDRGRPLPAVSLGSATLAAALSSPVGFVVGWWTRRAERNEAAAVIDEYRRTGTLREHLPAEIDITHRVIRVYRDERQWREQRRERLRSKATIVGVESGANSTPNLRRVA